MSSVTPLAPGATAAARSDATIRARAAGGSHAREPPVRALTTGQTRTPRARAEASSASVWRPTGARRSPLPGSSAYQFGRHDVDPHADPPQPLELRPAAGGDEREHLRRRRRRPRVRAAGAHGRGQHDGQHARAHPSRGSAQIRSSSCPSRQKPIPSPRSRASATRLPTVPASLYHSSWAAPAASV